MFAPASSAVRMPPVFVKAICAPHLRPDSRIASSRKWGAQIAFTNTGGIRTALDAGANNVVNVAQTQVVLPFGNEIVVMNLTGAQIFALLEGQWSGSESEKRGLLQVSEGFTYSWDMRKPKGQRIVRDSVKLNGVAIAAPTNVSTRRSEIRLLLGATRYIHSRIITDTAIAA